MATDANGWKLKVGDEVMMITFGVVKKVYDAMDQMEDLIVVSVDNEPDRYLRPSGVTIRRGVKSRDLTTAEQSEANQTLAQVGNSNRTI